MNEGGLDWGEVADERLRSWSGHEIGVDIVAKLKRRSDFGRTHAIQLRNIILKCRHSIWYTFKCRHFEINCDSRAQQLDIFLDTTLKAVFSNLMTAFSSFVDLSLARRKMQCLSRKWFRTRTTSNFSNASDSCKWGGGYTFIAIFTLYSSDILF